MVEGDLGERERSATPVSHSVSPVALRLDGLGLFMGGMVEGGLGERERSATFLSMSIVAQSALIIHCRAYKRRLCTFTD